MNDYDNAEVESTDIEPRTRRALERVLTVTHVDGTPIDNDESPTVVSVHSGNSGRERRVDVREGRCTCPDHEHRDSVCYHIRRARYALGVEPVPTETLAACDVHERFAEHAPGPVVATSDGGIVGGETDEETDETGTETTEAGERVRVPVSGGVLVYETRALGKELVGFVEVNNWDQVADALAARGHDRGACFHLPELDE